LLSLLALRLAQVRKTLPDDEMEFIVDHLNELPNRSASFSMTTRSGDRERLRQAVLPLPRSTSACRSRSCEAREISYIPTEAYSAGEMKHGPIAARGRHTGGRRGHEHPRLRQDRLNIQDAGPRCA
jgi:glucosamine--fructose-6-phosphate aminotransferase (isomerizing)